jgi:hypothetical protein
MRAKSTDKEPTMNKVTNTEALIAWHVAAATSPAAPVLPESLEVRRYGWKLAAQARFDASPVWKRGL